MKTRELKLYNSLIEHLLDLKDFAYLYSVPVISNDYINGHYTAIGYQAFAENLRYIVSNYINKHIDEFQDVYLNSQE